MKKCLLALVTALSLTPLAFGQCPNCPSYRPECIPCDRSPHPSLNPAFVKPDASPSDGDLPDVEVDPADRVHNMRNGQCVWASCETVGRACGLNSLLGITERAVREGWHGANPRNVTALMRDAQIPCEETYNSDRDFLTRAFQQGVPVVIFLPGHAVTAVGVHGSSIHVIDNNRPGQIRAIPYGMWEGYGCCPKLFPRIWSKRHPNQPLPGPSKPHPSPNPAQPVEVPTPKPDPVVVTPPPVPTPPPPVVVSPPAVDPKALADAVSNNIMVKIEPRFINIEKKVDALDAAVRTRFVPNANVPAVAPAAVK